MSTAPLTTALTRLRREAEERSDTQLLESYTAANDQGAFAALVRRHGPMVLGVCRRVLRDAHDAEDAFQAVFLSLARGASSIRKVEALTSWLHGVAYRISLRARRDAGRRRKHECQAQPRTEAPAWEVGWRELQVVLDEEVEQLPPTFRAAFVLCALEGLSKTEAARRLGLKANTVTSQLARARKRLQDRLGRRGISLSAVLAALAVSGAGRAALPPRLLWSTVPVTGFSARVVSLAERGTTMPTIKVKLALVLLSCMLGTGLVLFAQNTPQRTAPTEQRRPAKVPDETVEVKGRVLGPDGQPVAGAALYQACRVEFFRGDPLPSPRRCGTSGPDGRFRLRIPRSAWTERLKAVVQVVAVAAGFGPGWVRLDKAPDREVAVRLVKDDVPITGRILDLQGRPIRGAVIRVEGIQATPDENLTSWLQAVRAKKRVRHDEFLSRELIGSPVPGLPASIKTDAEGRFRLTGVGRERALVVLIGGRQLATEFALLLTRRVPRFEVFENLITDDKLTVYGASFQHIAAPAKPLTGTVRDKDTGKPLAGVKVGLDDPTFQAVTDKDGKFRLDSLPFDPDSHGFGLPVLAVPPRDQPYLVGFKEVKQGRGLEVVSVDFRLKRGVWVEGKVTDKRTGKSVRTNIEYCPAADNPNRKDMTTFGRNPGLARNIYSTEADGSFRVPVLPGRGTIMAHGQPTDYVTSGSATFNAPADGKPVACSIVLDPGRTLTGTVLSPDGKPLSGVHVFNMDPLHFWTTRPLASARFTVTALDPRGRRSLIFLYPEKRWVKAVELQGKAADPLTVRLEPAGTLTGRLVDEDGQPRPGVGLLIHFVRKDSGGIARYTRHIPDRLKTDREGRFRVEGLAPGVEYQINLAGKPGNMTIGSVANGLTVKPGETKDLGDRKGRLFTD